MPASVEDPVPEKKAKVFCSQTFRQELKGNEVLKSLKRFTTAAKNSEQDVILEYMEGGGSPLEILLLIDATAKGDLTTALPVFKAVHLILLRFQPPDSEFHQQCVEAAKYILRSFLLVIQGMLQLNNTKHRRAALELLTAMATLHPSFASEILHAISLTPTLISDLIQPTEDKESVRKYFILFTLSFLVGGNNAVVKSLLEKKGFLSSIIPGLKFDPATTVNLVLSLFTDKILKSAGIPKILKLKLFNTQIVKSLFELYDWKGPKSTKQFSFKKKDKMKAVEVNKEEKEIVVESVHSFLLLLCSSKKHGIAFSDESLGSSDKLSNQLLLTVFEGLSDPLTNNKIAEVLLKTLVNCPDLVKPTLFKLEPAFVPRSSKNWFEAMEFAENLITTISPSTLLKNAGEHLAKSNIIKVAKSLCTPVVFLRNVKPGIEKNQPLEVRLSSLKLLSVMWNESQKLFVSFKDIKKGIIQYILKYLPDEGDLIELWQNLCNPDFLTASSVPVEKRNSFLGFIIDSLQIFLECQENVVSSSLKLVSCLLENLDSIKKTMGDEEFCRIQVKIVKFVEFDIYSLTPDKEIFQRVLLILLGSSEDASIACASKILSSLTLFESSKSEVDVWLLCYVSLPPEYRPLVAASLLETIRRYYSKNDSTKRCIQSTRMDVSADLVKSIDAPEPSLTPLIFECIEFLKGVITESKKNAKEATAFQHYVGDVVIHLQHFYACDIFLYEHFESLKKILNKSVINYLKCWMDGSLESTNFDVFSCQLERDLVSWALNENKRNIEDIVGFETQLLKKYGLLRIIIAHLVNKAVFDKLTGDDIEKYTNALWFFMKTDTALGDIDSDSCPVSNDFSNTVAYYINCISGLFRNKHLISFFDIFNTKKKKNIYSTDIIVKILLKHKEINSLGVKEKFLEPWKTQFLTQLKSRLKKNKNIDNVNNLEDVLNFFHFDSSDIKEVIELLMSVSDLNLFLHDSMPSKWALILVTFAKLYRQKDELSDSIVKKLCLTMKYLNEEDCLSLEIMDECFVYLLKRNPRHLLLIENDFLKVILKRTNYTPSTFTLGKLLLNDPKKVNHFLKIGAKYLEHSEKSGLILSLLSILVENYDEFLDKIKSKVECLVWKISELEENSQIFQLLKSVYEKYEERIVRALTGAEEEVILKNLNIVRVLINLFIDKKTVKKLRKEIVKGIFQPELLHEGVMKLNNNEIKEFYKEGLIAFFVQKIKVSNDVEENREWSKYCSILSDLIEKDKNSWEAVSKLPTWKEFVKLALGLCFRTSKYSSVMTILRLLVTVLYQPREQSSDVALFFQMVISHSQFLKVILSQSPLKEELVKLIYCLVERSTSEMSAKHIPVFLASYNASMSESDMTLLKILKFYEKNGVNFSEYEPLVWGETAVSHYSIGTNPGLSLWQRFGMNNVLDLLDMQRMDTSLKKFPIHRSFEDCITAKIEHDSAVYDPGFLLPLFVNLVSPGSVVTCLPFIYKGGLAYAIRSLSSECAEIRLAASVVLARFYNHLELTQNMKQKLIWMHFINCLRYNMENMSDEPLPNIPSLFFSRMTLELSRHPAEMYIPLQNFLLAKSCFNHDTIPEFLPLFHSSDVAFPKHRSWLLEVLKDGTKSPEDLNIIYRSMALKIIFCFFHSELCDDDTRKLVLQVMGSILKVDKSALIISEYGLLNWISSLDSNSMKSILHDLLNFLHICVNIIKKDLTSNKTKRTSLSHIIQVLNISMRLLQAFKSVKSVEDFKLFLKIMNSCLILFTNEDNLGWFEMNEERLNDIIVTGRNILGDEHDYGKFRDLPFYFEDYEQDYESEMFSEMKRVVFLLSMLAGIGTV